VTRIVAGSKGGRRIAVPPGRDTRPTSDRVREALFSTLESLTGLAGCRFVDLYAGSGAVGLEAASRGASAVLLVESGKAAARTVRDNIAVLGLDQTCRLETATVPTVLARGPAEPYDVIFADPPYDVDDREFTGVLAVIVDKGWLAPAGVVVVERSARTPEPAWPDGVTTQRARRYGDTVLWYGRPARADHEGWPGGRQ
jgi:16S rRNA (guanine966-N2)-methyltransferase